MPTAEPFKGGLMAIDRQINVVRPWPHRGPSRSDEKRTANRQCLGIQLIRSNPCHIVDFPCTQGVRDVNNIPGNN